MAQITEWFETHQQTLQIVASGSLILLLVTLAAIPIVVMHLPTNYFAAQRRTPASRCASHKLLCSVLVILKNLLGVIVVTIGFALLIMPGQGIITIVIGLALMNFPGKFAVERWIVRQPKVSKTLNWIRTKVGKPPFEIPPKPAKAGGRKPSK